MMDVTDYPAVKDAKQDSLRFHDSCCFAGKAFFNFNFWGDFICYS